MEENERKYAQYFALIQYYFIFMKVQFVALGHLLPIPIPPQPQPL